MPGSRDGALRGLVSVNEDSVDGDHSPRRTGPDDCAGGGLRVVDAHPPGLVVAREGVARFGAGTVSIRAGLVIAAG
jgi:hypothetical protein